MLALTRLFLVAAALHGIAGAPPARAETMTPLERLNRQVFEVNKAFMHHIVRPATAAYQSQVPAAARQTIHAIYDNLLEPVTATAFALLGDINGVAASTTRFAMNSTLGALGVFDVAGTIGLTRLEKGFSEAVCLAGLPVGSYVVLPVVGPTTTGIAIVGGTLMVGSTVALSFVSLELALASLGIDIIEIAAVLQNTFQNQNPVDATYDTERQRFFDGLAKECTLRMSRP
ncbi:MAG TPA: MlaA family lipoprotein [Stellaceae bacterium]|nr:MlaA family lipoprotein [Stellaceae bacterium]